MTERTRERSARQWADILALVAGVALVGMSMWPSIGTTSPGGDAQVGSPRTVILVRLFAAAAALGGVIVAQRAAGRGVARALLGFGVAVLIVGLLVVRAPGTWEFWSLAIPAAALAAASLRVGPLQSD